MTDAGAPAALSPSWQQRFAFFDAYGLPSSSPEAREAIRALPLRDRFRITSNFLAFVCFPFYFFVKGMWRKGLGRVAVAVALATVGVALDVSDQVARAIGIGLAAGAMTTANYAYYLHVVKDSRSWNIFEGSAGVRRAEAARLLSWPVMTVSRLRPYATTIFAEMSALAARIGAVNLGQGFPDEDGPPAMLEAARIAIADGVNQYPPGPGIPALREAIADQRRRHFGTDYDPDTEVLVTVGATEAIAAAVFGLVEPGSEVLLIEPFYDSYSPVVAMAGARRVGVPLVPDGRGFAVDIDRLRRAVTPATRALIVNSPHNPTGTVFTEAELAAIARVAVEADLLVIADEVYEHLVFAGRAHLPLACFEGMAQRTVTISSAAKMFNCTGWKIGWACGPAELLAGVRAAKQYLSYVGGAPFQPAVALALNTEDAWVADLRATMQARRDRLADGLRGIGFEVHDSFGTYFLCADPRPLGYHDSTAFCTELPHRAGVAAIPLSAFCLPAGEAAAPDVWNHLVRFTFVKREDTLDEALRRLRALREGPVTAR